MTANKAIEIKNLTVTYISTKTDKFENVICYFKVTDTKAKKILTPIVSQICPECRLPLWETENIEYMLKVKQKYAPKGLTADAELQVMLTFKYYCMSVGDGNINQGYYRNVNIMKELSKDADEDDIYYLLPIPLLTTIYY